FLNSSDWYSGDRRLAAPAFIVIRAVECERCRTARTHAGDEVSRVYEKVSSTLPLPKRRIEEGKRRRLPAQDRRLIDLRAAEGQADLRICTYTFCGAVDGDFGLLGADKECHLKCRGLTGAQCDVLALFVSEPVLR